MLFLVDIVLTSKVLTLLMLLVPVVTVTVICTTLVQEVVDFCMLVLVLPLFVLVTAQDTPATLVEACASCFASFSEYKILEHLESELSVPSQPTLLINMALFGLL